MEKWYDIVRKLQDESENKYLTRHFAEHVYHDLKNSRIREKQKFKNRMGPEFEHWSASLLQDYAKDMIVEILNDDDFWIETMLITQGI